MHTSEQCECKCLGPLWTVYIHYGLRQEFLYSFHCRKSGLTRYYDNLRSESDTAAGVFCTRTNKRLYTIVQTAE